MTTSPLPHFHERHEAKREHGKDKRDEVLGFIAGHIGEHGYPPNVREIAAAVGLHSNSTVHYHLVLLEKEGKIRRRFRHNRAIALVDPEPSPLVQAARAVVTAAREGVDVAAAIAQLEAALPEVVRG